MRRRSALRRKRQPVSPFEYYALAALVIIAAGTFLIFRRYSLDLWEAYLIVVNTSTFAFYGLDKSMAWSHRKRIPEKILLSLALIGGSPGGLAAMTLFRHKISQFSFQRVFWIIVVIQIIIIVILFLLLG